MTAHLPRPDRTDELAAAVAELAWTWVRRELGLAPGEPLFSPPERARQVQLTLLGVLERMRAAVDDRARAAAYEAAAAGADYGDLGDAVGMTRQGARRRWPDLAEITKAARRT